LQAEIYSLGHYDNKWEYLERDKKKRAEEIRRQAIDVQKTLGQIGKHYGMEGKITSEFVI